MRFFIPAFLLLTYPAWSQEPIDKLISEVEQGLTPHTVIENNSPANNNILDRMENWKVNKVSIAVIDRNAIAWAKVYSLKNGADTTGRFDTATLFQCASIGKIITALAALHLVDKGYITLDENVNNKLVGWKIADNDHTARKKVTLRHLLSHSSGLADGYGFTGYPPGTKIPHLLQILNAVAPAYNRKKLVVGNTPGSIERYSGGGYIIIQQLIEDITGVAFDKYVDSIVFKPLGMIHSTYHYYPDSIPGKTIAEGHNEQGNPYRKFRYKIYPELAAAGPWTTATDLARMVIGVQKIKAGISNKLDKQLIEEMLSPQINSMGLGVHLKGDKEVTGFWHAGNNKGYTGILMATTETGQGAIVLTNSNRGEWLAMEILRSVASTYRWPITLSIVPMPVLNATEYCGTYVVAKGRSLEISNDRKGLYFIRNRKKFYMYQTAKDNFRLAEKPDNMLFVFKRNEQDSITGVAVYEMAGRSSYFLHRL